MFGKGAKRKLDEDEEGLEDKALAPGQTTLLPGPGGFCPEGLSKVSYTLQRQTIFNISLMKLCTQRPLSEPSLERRVLINNMLRRIQDELKTEGSLRPLLLPPSPPPDDPMDEGYREAPPSFGVGSSAAAAAQLSQQPLPLLSPALAPPSPLPLAQPAACPALQLVRPAPLEACLTPASLLEEDSDASFCTSSFPPTPPLSPLPGPPAPSLPPPPALPALLSQAPSRVLVPATSEPGFPTALSGLEQHSARTASAAANSPPTTTSHVLPAPQPPLLAPVQPKDWPKTGGPKVEGVVLLADSRGVEIRAMDTLPPPSGLVDMTSSPSSPSSSSSSSTGFLSDLALDDILFADIDTSMYDFDPCTTSAAAGGGLSKLSPMVTADDLLKSLASPYAGPTPQVSPNQPFKIDLTELDHIMEVLVGS
ncbi:SERTA domain-containing protein 2b [Aplochiton taeniatus]